MSKTERINPSADEMAMMMRRNRIVDIGMIPMNMLCNIDHIDFQC